MLHKSILLLLETISNLLSSNNKSCESHYRRPFQLYLIYNFQYIKIFSLRFRHHWQKINHRRNESVICWRWEKRKCFDVVDEASFSRGDWQGHEQMGQPQHHCQGLGWHEQKLPARHLPVHLQHRKQAGVLLPALTVFIELNLSFFGSLVRERVNFLFILGIL